MAQVDLSAGIDLDYPQLLTHEHTFINGGQLSSGLRAGILLKPENAAFFPGLNFSYGRARLPLDESGMSIAALNFNYLNVMLNENLEVRLSHGGLFIYAGIGLSYLKENSVAPSGVQTKTTNIDSALDISKVFPAAAVGFEYHYSIKKDDNCYLALGLDFQYTLLFANRDTYYVTVSEPVNNIYHYRTELTGGLLSPGIHFALHYKFQKKKSGLYL